MKSKMLIKRFFICMVSVILLVCIEPIDRISAYASNTHAASIDNSTPFIMLSSYKVTNNEITRGKSFELSLTIKNTHAYKNATDVVVDVSSVSGIVPVYPTVNQKYISNMAPGEETEVVFSYSASNYFEDENAIFYVYISSGSSDNSVMISVPVKMDESIFYILSANVPEEAIAGESISSSIHFKSRSSDKIGNISMRIYLDDVEYASSSIGNLSGGASKTQNSSFTIYETGKHHILYEIEWISDEGKEQKMTAYSGELTIVEAPNQTETEEEWDIPEERFSESDLAVIGVCAGAILLCLLGIVFIAIRYNRGGRR